MNYVVLVHIISIQTKQNETSNNQGASLRIKKMKICTSRKKNNIYIGYSLQPNVLNTH